MQVFTGAKSFNFEKGEFFIVDLTAFLSNAV